MSRLSGVALVLAGLSVAAYTLPLAHDPTLVAADPPQPPAQGAARPDAAVVAQAQEPSGGSRSPAGGQPQAVVKAAPPSVQAVQPPPPAKVVPLPSAALAVPPPRMPVSQATAASGPLLDHAGLTREIQRHLKRVGCYAGDVSGVWTPTVRRAMKAFTDRVNATLPIEEPDYILLAMVQNHQGKACGQGCPAGENAAEDGRCLPKAIIALGAKKQAVPDAHSRAGDTAATAPAPTPDPVPAPQGRMALAGPQQADTSLDAQPGRSKIDHSDGPAARPIQPYAGRKDADTRDRRRIVRGTSNGGMPTWAAKAFSAQP
jgi:hypothetical protein